MRMSDWSSDVCSSDPPMPPIRPWQPALEAFSVTHEAELLATANAALAARGAAPLGHPADALNGDTTLVFSLPQVRSTERSVGTGRASTCSSRWSLLR